MPNLFFYGTLRHWPLLEIVLGRSLPETDCQEAQLGGYDVLAIKDQPFPTITKGTGPALGLLVRNLSTQDIEKLNFYEGGFSYHLQDVEVETKCKTEIASVYFPAANDWQTGALWSLSDWQSEWGEMTCFAAQELMGYFGKRSPKEIDFMFPMIRTRASVKVTAQQNNHAFSPSGFTRDDVVAEGMDRPFTNFFSVEEHNLRFRQYDGGQSELIKREVFAASDATIILPYDPIRDCVMLVEQFRPGPYARNDNLPWMLEPIAGRIDPGETPEQAAGREAFEEAGLSLTALHQVAQCYASPGCSTEFFFVYVAETELPESAAGIAGLDSEAEDIKSYILSFDALMDLVDTMQAANAPLVLAALWLARHRDRLRATA